MSEFLKQVWFDFGEAISFALACVFGLLIILAVANKLNEYECSQKYSDYEWRFETIAGCRIKIDGRWIPVKNWRAYE